MDDRKKVYRLIVAALAELTPPRCIEIGSGVRANRAFNERRRLLEIARAVALSGDRGAKGIEEGVANVGSEDDRRSDDGIASRAVTTTPASLIATVGVLARAGGACGDPHETRF